MWFETLVGFREESPEQVRSNIFVENETMSSAVNGRQMRCGRLETPSLAELRDGVRAMPVAAGSLQLSEVVADIQDLHIDPKNANAMFQVASQFNLLEMVSPSVAPEDGVAGYENDRTQGPACAIACGASTIYRNYFAPVNGRMGQTEGNQIDCLHDLGIALGNADQQLWKMKNGYALATADGLNEISQRLAAEEESEKDCLRGLVRIGVQANAEVTIYDAPQPHCVSQAFCSALPVAYSPHPDRLWAEFARLILEAAYEATICAGILNMENTGNNRVYLTLLGGGAFGNREDWILAAIHRAMRLYSEFNLDVYIVSYGVSKPSVQELVMKFSSTN
jgi:hypothetical protein